MIYAGIVYLVEELCSFINTMVLIHIAHIKSKNKDPYNTYRYIFWNNAFTSIIQTALGLLGIYLISLVTSKYIYFCVAIVILFMVRDLLCYFIYKGLSYLTKIRLSKKVGNELSNMQKTILSPNQEKAQQIINNHYRGNRKD